MYFYNTNFENLKTYPFFLPRFALDFLFNLKRFFLRIETEEALSFFEAFTEFCEISVEFKSSYFYFFFDYFDKISDSFIPKK